MLGEPYVLYTISLTAVYENGPGKEVRLHTYTKEGSEYLCSVVISIA